MGHGYDNMAGNDNGKKKKMVIAGATSLILVAMVVGVAVSVKGGNSSGSSSTTGGSGSSSSGVSTTSKSIKAICQPTDYKETCEESLSKAAGNTTDPQKLVQVGFQVAINALHDAINKSETIKEAEKDPMAKQALDNCKELVDTAVDDLKRSFDQLGSFDMTKFTEYVDNLKIWLSATITYQQTCLDGFENTTSDAGDKMKHLLGLSSQLTSNGLAMIDGLSSIIQELQIPGIGRRLMEVEDGLPSWITAGRRHLLATPVSAIKADAVVAKDGTGNFSTISAALDAIPKKRNGTYVIHIKAGVYKEQISVPRNLNDVMFVGDGPTKTTITGSLNFAKGTQTFKTSTVSVSGERFMAKDIGFENTAGAIGHQAVALRVQSDMSIFYNCHMDGYQDTLYAHTYRQFYRDCVITGTIDFIFGDAAAVFQNCKMVVRKPLENQQCIVTANGRNDSRETTAFVIQNCTITADPAYFPVRFTNKAYLARPWKEYSKTIYMNSQIDDLIDPQGWLPWMGSFALDTCYYAEYGNRGKGSVTSKRATWKGVKKITAAEAKSYTPAKFLGGDLWIPQTGVPYTAGMISV